MEVFECIKTRRSVRRFEDRPVERETIQKIVDAAILGTIMEKFSDTALYCGEQTRNRDDIAEKMAAATLPLIQRHKQTPVLIVVSYVKGICGFEKDGSYSTDKKKVGRCLTLGSSTNIRTR